MSPRNRENVSLSKRLGWRMEALAYDIICLFLRLLGFRHASALGGWLLRRIGPRTSKQRIVLRNLAIAFPELESPERQALARRAWENVGRTFFEFPLMHRLDIDADVRVEGMDHLEALASHGERCVVVTGHFANWEVMAAVLARAPLDVAITYRRINNPHIDARVVAQRERYGTTTLVPKSGAAGARHLLTVMKAGTSIALLNDQKFNTGLSVPFFGQPAMTAPGPSRLAIKQKVALVKITCRREGDGFVVRIEPPVRPTDVETSVREIVSWTEDVIRSQPEQWFWPHHRWPKDLYRKG